MISIEVPGRGALAFEHLILDLNGTLATDGIVSEAVAGRLRELLSGVQVHLVTADTFGTASTLEHLGIHILALGPGAQVEAKAGFVRGLGASRTVAIGNGMNDEGMLREAALGIVVVGREGAAARVLLAALSIGASEGRFFTPPARDTAQGGEGRSFLADDGLYRW
jgi:soluble P-type ATPase